jgi:diketogulonate reductase-like aldo/keto reductase
MPADRGQPTVRLGQAGSMPLVGLGTWQMTGARCQAAVRYALKVGYRHLDTATIYRNEGEVGRAVRDSGVPREQVFITTKLPPGAAGRERRTLEGSLRALGMDYVDLWLVHWPALARRRGNSRTGLRPGSSPRSASMPG